jgi:hypothetical protein
VVSDLVQVGLDQVVLGLGDRLPLRALVGFLLSRVPVGVDRRDDCSKSALLLGLPALGARCFPAVECPSDSQDVGESR